MKSKPKCSHWLKHFDPLRGSSITDTAGRIRPGLYNCSNQHKPVITMKSASILLLVGCLTAFAETEERISKKFPVQPGGKLVMDVDFGAIDVNTNATGEITVDVLRKVSRRNKSDEETYLSDRPVVFSQDGNTLTIRSRAKTQMNWSFRGSQRTEGKYTITVPAQFNTQVKTSGGGIAISDLTGETKADTSGGGLKFTRLHGPLDGGTSGGGVRVSECEGTLKVHTSGGGIEVTGGAGKLDGDTSGGSVVVRDFKGPAQVGTSGGGITIENVTGKVAGSTSGGSISARFSSPLTDEVSLETSGGGVTVQLAGDSAFDLDAATSGGGVSSDLPVTVTGKVAHDHLKGPVNGGGKSVVLRSSGGSIHVKKL